MFVNVLFEKRFDELYNEQEKFVINGTQVLTYKISVDIR